MGLSEQLLVQPGVPHGLRTHTAHKRLHTDARHGHARQQWRPEWRPSHSFRAYRSMNDLLLEDLCIEGPAACDIAHGPAFSIVLPAGVMPGEEEGFRRPAPAGKMLLRELSAAFDRSSGRVPAAHAPVVSNGNGSKAAGECREQRCSHGWRKSCATYKQAPSHQQEKVEFLCFRTSRRRSTGGPTCPLRQIVGKRRPHVHSEIAWRRF